MKSSTINWIYKQETYRFAHVVWDIDAAKRIIEKRPRDIITIDITPMKICLTRPTDKSVPLFSVNWDVVDAVDNDDIDLSVPLILVTIEDGVNWVIDGWHRSAKALEKGKTELPAVVLTKRESNRIKL